MPKYINHYDHNNKYYIQFNKLMPENPIINKWYPINKYTFIYINNKGYFHMTQLKKAINKYYFTDYILTGKPKMELKFNHDSGYFNNLEEVKEYIQIREGDK
ncbi:MAG TPA: hypothetical protein GX708_23380 [Gallicola sp.]|nr:hypothetical protein [Gallicola sp.]